MMKFDIIVIKKFYYMYDRKQNMLNNALTWFWFLCWIKTNHCLPEAGLVFLQTMLHSWGVILWPFTLYGVIQLSCSVSGRTPSFGFLYLESHYFVPFSKFMLSKNGLFSMEDLLVPFKNMVSGVGLQTKNFYFLLLYLIGLPAGIISIKYISCQGMVEYIGMVVTVW